MNKDLISSSERSNFSCAAACCWLCEYIRVYERVCARAFVLQHATACCWLCEYMRVCVCARARA